MFEFIDIEALNYYRKIEDKVLFFFETSWSDECETFLSKLIEIQEDLNIPVYRVELDLDGGEYIRRKFGVDTAPTVIIFSDGEEDKRITDLESLEDLI
jgi:thioredoxin-like negative regulator of GroEL